MVLTITQFGGGWGNTAGDCCLIQWDSATGEKSHILIDLGRSNKIFNSMYETMQKQCGSSTLKGVILTHLHSDHIGGSGLSEASSSFNDQLKKTLKKLKKDEGFLILPQFTHFRVLKDEIVEKYGELLTDRTFNITIDSLSLNIELIYPILADSVGKEENKHSLGCLITVTCPGKIWRMLTLGDMENVSRTNTTAERAIRNVVGDKEIHVIKLPHHGSTNNYMEEVLRIINTHNSKVIISGFTGGDVQHLKKYGEKAQKMYFLFGQHAKEDGNVTSFIYGSNRYNLIPKTNTYLDQSSSLFQDLLFKPIEKKQASKLAIQNKIDLSFYPDEKDFVRELYSDQLYTIPPKRMSLTERLDKRKMSRSGDKGELSIDTSES